MKRQRKVLTLEEMLRMTPAGRRMALHLGYLFPIAGAEEPDGDEEEHESEENEEEDHSDDDEESGDEDEDDDDESTSISLAELNRLRRIAAESDKARKAAEREAKRRKEREQREQGQWQELLDERDERIRELEAERDEIKYEHGAFQRKIRVTNAAVRLGFKDPADAVQFLSTDETEDDASTEAALKRLSKKKPYLVETRRSSGAPINGEGGSGLTYEQVQKMSPEEVNANWAEVQKVLASGGAR